VTEAEYVRACRLELELTQRELAQELGVSRGRVAALESGAQHLKVREARALVERAPLVACPCCRGERDRWRAAMAYRLRRMADEVAG